MRMLVVCLLISSLVVPSVLSASSQQVGSSHQAASSYQATSSERAASLERAGTPEQKAPSEQTGRPEQSHLPSVHIAVNVYEVTGAVVEGLKPMDLDALNALVAETRDLPDTPSGRARLIASPELTMLTGDSAIMQPARMSAQQVFYISAEGNGYHSAEDHPANHQLREINLGVQLQARAWRYVRSESILLETQLEVSDLEGFIELEVASAEGGTRPAFIPAVKTIANYGTRLLASGETGILAWQEEFSGSLDQPQRKLMVITVTPTLLPSQEIHPHPASGQ